MHIPFAGRNTKYNASIGRPRLLVLNKMDLTKMTQAKVDTTSLSVSGTVLLCDGRMSSKSLESVEKKISSLRTVKNSITPVFAR